MTKVKRIVEGKQLDTCLLEGHEKRLKSIDTDLHGIKQDRLLIDDYESIAGKAASLEEFSLSYMSSHQVPAKKRQDRVCSK